MATEKKLWIKTADFESKMRLLETDIKETEHLTKIGVLRLLDRLKKDLIESEEAEYKIIKELEM